jgi:hypothetical protein
MVVMKVSRCASHHATRVALTKELVFIELHPTKT